MIFKCEKDERLYNRSLLNTLGLICGNGNVRLREQLLDVFNQKCEVKTYDLSENNSDTQEMNRIGAKGLTGHVGDFLEENMLIRLFGCNANKMSEYDFMQHATHETFHAWSEFLPTVFRFSKDRTIDNVHYKNISGTIYRELQGNEQNNKTYGGCYNECMMDILSESAFVGYDETIISNGINVDTILKESRNKWYHNSNEGLTHYSGFYDFTRLAIAAFSNDPNFSFQNCINNHESIIFAGCNINGKRINKNDFIFGTLCDPFVMMDKYDEVMGEGRYFKFCDDSQEIFDAFLQGQGVSQTKIYNVVNSLTNFTAEKCRQRIADGTFSKDDAAKIFNNVLRIRGEIFEKYHIEEKLDTRPIEIKTHRIQPTQLSQLSQTTIRENPGRLSAIFGKVKRIFNKIFNKDRENQ